MYVLLLLGFSVFNGLDDLVCVIRLAVALRTAFRLVRLNNLSFGGLWVSNSYQLLFWLTILADCLFCCFIARSYYA